jgi:putative ABC transport system ATP-binding protein
MRFPPEVPILEFRDVSRRWRAGILGATHESLALENVSFRVAPGEIIAITGAPGAGKSTLLLLAAGQAAPTSGSIRWRGTTDPAAVRAQLIGARPWEYHFLTVRQALAFHADVLALKDDALAAPTRFVPLMARVGLRGRSRVRLGQLDALDRLRVVLAQALLARPSLICCEEPFAFCGPEERRQGVRLLRSIAADGIALLLATREASTLEAYGLADRGFPLERGRLGPTRRPMRTVLELAVPSPEDAMARLASRLPSLARRGRRLRVPLFGHSPEAILALCRDAGVQVRASRVAEEGIGPEPQYPSA